MAEMKIEIKEIKDIEKYIKEIKKIDKVDEMIPEIKKFYKELNKYIESIDENTLTSDDIKILEDVTKISWHGVGKYENLNITNAIREDKKNFAEKFKKIKPTKNSFTEFVGNIASITSSLSQRKKRDVNKKNKEVDEIIEKMESLEDIKNVVSKIANLELDSEKDKAANKFYEKINAIEKEKNSDDIIEYVKKLNANDFNMNIASFIYLKSRKDFEKIAENYKPSKLQEVMNEVNEIKKTYGSTPLEMLAENKEKKEKFTKKIMEFYKKYENIHKSSLSEEEIKEIKEYVDKLLPVDFGYWIQSGKDWTNIKGGYTISEMVSKKNPNPEYGEKPEVKNGEKVNLSNLENSVNYIFEYIKGQHVITNGEEVIEKIGIKEKDLKRNIEILEKSIKKNIELSKQTDNNEAINKSITNYTKLLKYYYKVEAEISLPKSVEIYYDKIDETDIIKYFERLSIMHDGTIKTAKRDLEKAENYIEKVKNDIVENMNEQIVDKTFETADEKEIKEIILKEMLDKYEDDVELLGKVVDDIENALVDKIYDDSKDKLTIKEKDKPEIEEHHEVKKEIEESITSGEEIFSKESLNIEKIIRITNDPELLKEVLQNIIEVLGLSNEITIDTQSKNNPDGELKKSSKPVSIMESIKTKENIDDVKHNAKNALVKGLGKFMESVIKSGQVVGETLEAGIEKGAYYTGILLGDLETLGENKNKGRK